MTKQSLIDAIADKAGITKANATSCLKAFQDVVTEELASGGKVQLVGFGTFEVANRSPRKGRNPKTGEVMDIPASKAAKFKAGKALKDAVNV